MFPTRQHVRAYLKEQMAAERVQGVSLDARV